MNSDASGAKPHPLQSLRNTIERGIANERREITTEEMEMNNKTNEKASSLRWKILRQALLSNPSPSISDDQSQTSIKRISRRTSHGFNLIPSHVIDDEGGSNNCSGSSIKDALVCYTLPIPNAPRLFLRQMWPKSR